MKAPDRPGDLFFVGAAVTALIIEFLSVGWWHAIGIALAAGWFLNERVRLRGE